MKKQHLLLFFFVCFTLVEGYSQRFLAQTFTNVNRQDNVIYGSNFTVLTLSTTGRTSRQPLACDVYQPAGDTMSARPLVIFIPTSNFLPKSVRRSPTGDKQDSVAVEICTRLAKMGYVSSAINYRFGWNPIATTQTERVFTLINAAYRGIQDVRAAVRFFKANAATYKVDTNRIVLWGEGTGGYISLGATTLNVYAKVFTTARPQGKFTTNNNGQVVPMVIESLNGNIDGTNLTISPGAPFPYPQGDTLNAPNTVGPTSRVHFQVNMGGAIGDFTWLDAASTPQVNIACPHDQNAPYRDSVLLVPIGGGQALPVVQVQGSHWVALRADSLGLNSSFARIRSNYDPYRSLVAPRNAAAGYGNTYASGLLPMIGRSNNDSAPWQWWSLTEPNGSDSAALAGNPGMSAVKARLYIDSIMTFTMPRICVGLNLPCANVVTSTEDLLLNAQLTVAPNPASTLVVFESEATNPIKAIEVFDMSGRSVKMVNNVNSNQYQLDRGSLPQGMYLAKVKFEGGIITRKIIFE